MENEGFKIPILLLMFNRPDYAVQVFKQVRLMKPEKLYVAIDGPRTDSLEDKVNVDRCLSILNYIDWPCEIKTLIRKHNLGCGKAVSSAIDWFFGDVDMGIILEDDCLPDESFFRYCQELLYKYQHNPMVMHIGGVNYQNGNQRGSGSYYFTKICHIWGWATWRRAWSLYDYDMENFPQFINEKAIQQLVDNSDDQTYWIKAFENVYRRNIDTWDYQWVYAIWTSNALCILPNENLVTNIGFDSTATHTTSKHLYYADKKRFSIGSIVHPKFILEDKTATEYSLKNQFRIKKGILKKIDRIKLRIRYRTLKLK